MSALVAVSAFVASHGFSTDIRDGQVWALVPWSLRTVEGLTTGAEWEPMGTTVATARDGLGY